MLLAVEATVVAVVAVLAGTSEVLVASEPESGTVSSTPTLLETKRLALTAPLDAEAAEDVASTLRCSFMPGQPMIVGTCPLT